MRAYIVVESCASSPRRPVVAAVVLVLLMVAAACGGSDNEQADQATPTATPVGAIVTPVPPTATAEPSPTPTMTPATPTTTPVPPTATPVPPTAATPVPPTATPVPPTATATPLPSITNGTGRLSITALAGPTCPVETFPPRPECAPRPVEGAVIVVDDANGNELARGTTGSDGMVVITVASGTATVVPQPVQGLLGTAPPATVSVPAGRTVSIVVDYDTGIR